MKRLLLGAVLAAILSPCAAQLQPPQSTPRLELEALYQEALRAMAEGRLEEASSMLQRVVTQEPRHAGAWLDLAMSQCELGNASEAERLFKAFERRFPTSPALADTIAHYRASGCGKRAAAHRGEPWLLVASLGHDDNVNQGASDPRFTLGSGSAQGEYELAPAFLPRADNYQQLSGSWLHPIGKTGSSLILQAYSRWHQHERGQDTASALGALEHVWKAGGWQLRSTATLGYSTLDRVLYQRQQQVQARLATPLALAPGAQFSLYGSFNHVRYPTRPAYDGNTVELGGIVSYQARQGLAQATLTQLHDDSAAGRPGGDRQGWFGSLQWYGSAGPRIGVEAGLTHQHWLSDSVYSSGLIDFRRRQQTTVLRAAGNWQLRPHVGLALEWRGTFNRENISLFQYNSRALQLSLRWDNF